MRNEHRAAFGTLWLERKGLSHKPSDRPSIRRFVFGARPRRSPAPDTNNLGEFTYHQTGHHVLGSRLRSLHPRPPLLVERET